MTAFDAVHDVREAVKVRGNSTMSPVFESRFGRISAKPAEEKKREWMGIEPTWPLFRGHTGFEARGGHQIRVHSRRRDAGVECPESGAESPVSEAERRRDGFGSPFRTVRTACFKGRVTDMSTVPAERPRPGG